MSKSFAFAALLAALPAVAFAGPQSQSQGDKLSLIHI